MIPRSETTRSVDTWIEPMGPMAPSLKRASRKSTLVVSAPAWVKLVMGAGQVQAALARLEGRIVLHFLPPYCPDHNRIERVWRDLHANVTRNHQCRTLTELMDEVAYWLKKRNRELQRTYSLNNAA